MQIFHYSLARIQKPGTVSLVCAVLLYSAVSFLQVQVLRPDWHAAMHSKVDEHTGCGCGHRQEKKDTSDGEHPSNPFDRDCAFTIAAASTGISDPVIALPAHTLEYLSLVGEPALHRFASDVEIAKAGDPPVSLKA